MARPPNSERSADNSTVNDRLDAATGAALIAGSMYLATRIHETGAAIHTYYSNIRARTKRVYRGRLAWLAWGFTPDVKQATYLAVVLVVAGIGLGVVFIVQSI